MKQQEPEDSDSEVNNSSTLPRHEQALSRRSLRHEAKKFPLQFDVERTRTIDAKLELSGNGCTQRIKPVIAGSSSGEEPLLDQDESEDESDEDDYFGLIETPDRDQALSFLTEDSRRCLKEDGMAYIEKEMAESCLSEERFRYVVETNPDADSYSLSDSGEFLFLFWYTDDDGPPDKYIVVGENRVMKLALGYIRDQVDHKICWAYVVCDMNSSYRVLHGLDMEFVPLSPHFLCMNVDTEKYEEEKRKALEVGAEHCCSANTILKGLMYAKIHGIPRETQANFDCLKSKPFIAGDVQGLCKIKEVFRYETLELALERVQQGYPVAANLLCFEGWDRRIKDDEDFIYMGPNGCGKYTCVHGVIIMDFKEINGFKVAICKSSNGERVGKRGFLYVDTGVMLTLVGAVKDGKDERKWCRNKPHHLLYEFYSIDVELGPRPLIEVDPIQANEHMKFQVKPENYDVSCLFAPIYSSTATSGTVEASKKLGGELTSSVSMEDANYELTNEQVNHEQLIIDVTGVAQSVKSAVIGQQVLVGDFQGKETSTPMSTIGPGTSSSASNGSTSSRYLLSVASALDPEIQSGLKEMKTKQDFFGQSASQRGRNAARMAMTRRMHPVLSLNPYQGSWTIKVGVANKGLVRTCNNSRGEGCLFNVELTDEQGTQIQATMSNAAARKFYDRCQMEKVYYTSRGSLKQANKQLTLNENSEAIDDFLPSHELVAYVNHERLSGMSSSASNGSTSLYSDRVCLSHFTTNLFLGEEKPAFCSTKAHIKAPDQIVRYCACKKVTEAMDSGYWCDACQNKG